MLWNDEFNETVLDESIWNFEAHEPGWVNDELQEYTTSIDNVYLENGNAVIRAIKTTDSDGNDTYTSGNITSKKINDFISGKVVVKAKIPKGQGLWPAISMIANDESKSRDLSNCFTIDILDIQGYQPELAYGGIHYGIHYMEYGGDYELKDRTFADDFHEFSIEWEPDEMRFFIDDNLFYTAYDWKSFMEEAEEDTSAYPAEFNQNFLLQINLAVGGISPGSPDATTDFENAKFQIDYVRVYKKE